MNTMDSKTKCKLRTISYTFGKYFQTHLDVFENHFWNDDGFEKLNSIRNVNLVSLNNQKKKNQ